MKACELYCEVLKAKGEAAPPEPPLVKEDQVRQHLPAALMRARLCRLDCMDVSHVFVSL